MPATVPRWRRARAILRDFAELLGALVVASLAAAAWLMVRTHAGRDDIAELDAIIAAAVVLAIPPAWFVRYALAASEDGSAGQQGAALEVRGGRRGRALRVAMHPLSLPAWGWLVLVTVAAGAPLEAAVVGFVGVTVALAAVISVLRWAGPARRPGLHDLAAGTQLVARERRPS